MENESLPSLRLGEVLFGRTRRRLLSLVFSSQDQWFHTRDIHRRTGAPLGALSRELALLTEAGVVRREGRGNQVLYSANPDSPIFAELRAIVTKTIGIGDVIREALRPLAPRIKLAFLYGSFARGEQRGRSDVDVMVIGDLDFADVAAAAGEAERKLSREVNVSLYDPKEYRRRLTEENPFITRVTECSKIWLIGRESDLRKLQPAATRASA